MRSTIGGKITFAFLVLIALMVMMVGIVIQGFDRVTSSIDSLEREFVKRDASSNLRFTVAQLLMASNDYIITEKEYYRREYDRLNARVEDFYNQFLQLSPTEEEQRLLVGIKQDLDSIRSYSAQIFAIQHPRQSPKAWALMETMDYRFGDEVNRKTTEIFDGISRRIEHLGRLAAASRENASNSIYGILILSVLIALLVSYLTVQRIAKPIVAVTKAANGIASGDYSQRPVVKTHDEVAVLAQSFIRMAESIQQSQRALEESKRLTESIVSTVPSGLLVFGSDGTILSVNNGFCDIFGLSDSHLTGLHIESVLKELPLSEECRNHILARKPVRDVECTCSDTTRGTWVLSMSLFPMGLTNGESLLVVEDITRRKLAEQIILNSERRFRALIENSSDGLIIISADGTLLYGSPGSIRIVGYQHGELLNKNIFTLIHPDDYPSIMTLFTKLLEEPSRVMTAELRVQHKDGTWRWIETVAKNCLHDLTIKGVVINFRDTTERKRMEEAIRLAEERYRQLVELSPDAVFVHAGQKLVFANLAGAKLLGASNPHEVLGKPSLDFIHPDDLEKVRQRISIVIDQQKTTELAHIKVRRLDGTVVDAEVVSAPLRHGGQPAILTVARDITERKRTEEVLRESEERFRTVVEQTGQLIYDYDVASGAIRWAGGIEQITGYSPSEFQSFDIHRWEEHIHPDDRSRAVWLLDESRKTHSAYHVEYRFLKKDGSYVTVEDHGVFLYDVNGNAYRMLGTMSNISWRKLAEEKLQHQHQTLQALATVGQTLASSLDINVILSRILDTLSKLFCCSSSAVLLYDADSGTLSIVAQQGHERQLIEDLVIHVETEGVTGLAVKERKVVYVPDVRREPRYVRGKESVRTELAIPLSVAGYVIGVLDVQDDRVDAFDSEKISVLTQFANYAAVALENARLFQQTQWQLKELFVINEIMRLSQSGLSFEEVVKAAAETLTHQFQYYCVTVFLCENGAAARRICSFGEGSALLPDTDVIPINECLVGKVLETEKPIVVNDLNKEPQYARWVGSTTQSRLCVPIKRGNVFVGTINVDSEKKHAFRSTDVATVSGIAVQLSAADERVRLLEDLRASEQKYMSLYEDAPDMYHTQDENGIILMCNETLARTLGYAKTDILGRSILEFMPQEFHASCMGVRATVLKSGTVSDYECQLRRQNGSIIDVLVSARTERLKRGNVVIHVAMRDVTEKKRAERELLHFANALSQTADSVVVTDRSGIIQYVNRAFEQTTGFSKEEAIGKTPRIVKSGLHPKEFYVEMWNTILAGKVYRGTFINRRKNGDLFWEEKTITPVLDRLGNVVNFVSAGRDVTERRKLEQQLAQAHKMETIGTLASGIAHDFNNVLSGIGAYTELLERRGSEQRDATWYAKQIGQLKQRGEELTKLLLSFVRREEQPFQAVDINDLVHEVALLGKKTFPKTIEITVKAGTEPLCVQGNRTELYQVLLNLCVNARDAMPKGGVLTIEAEKSYLSDEIQKSLMQTEGATSTSVKITVTDTGTGIPFSILNKIFDPFFTTKAPGKGTGLGLSVVYNIVRNHHGLIDVKSQEGQGTTFTIILPAVEPPASGTASP